MWFAQDHEDEIIADTLDHIGIRNQWCFEVGAGDGVRFSNVKHFIDLGWMALLVERDPQLYAKLVDQFTLPKMCVPTVHAANITADGAIMEALMDAVGCPDDPDIGVIDIDGEDYWMWADLTRYKPRVMCVEYGTCTDPGHLPVRGQAIPAKKQAGRDRIIELGKCKGYELVKTTACNVIMKDRLA